MKTEEIQQLQNHYNEWVQIYPALEKSLALWKQAEALLHPLSDFYRSTEWRELYDNFDEPLDTQGNYSILSQDALWNAFADYRSLYEEMEKLLRHNRFHSAE